MQTNQYFCKHSLPYLLNLPPIPGTVDNLPQRYKKEISLLQSVISYVSHQLPSLLYLLLEMTLQQSNLTTQHSSLHTLLLQVYCRLSTAKNFLLYSLCTVSFHGTVSFSKSTVCCTSDHKNNNSKAARWCSFPLGLSAFFPKSTSVCHLPSLAGIYVAYAA